MIRRRFLRMAGEAEACGWGFGDVLALGVFCAGNPELRVTAKERAEAERARRKVAREQARARAAAEAAGKPAAERIAIAWPEANRNTERAGKWMHRGDARPRYQVLRVERRRKGRAALTEISEKAPVKKLAKIAAKYAWQTADAGGASQREP